MAASGSELCWRAVPTANPARRIATSSDAVATTCPSAPVVAANQKAAVKWARALGVAA